MFIKEADKRLLWADFVFQQGSMLELQQKVIVAVYLIKETNLQPQI